MYIKVIRFGYGWEWIGFFAQSAPVHGTKPDDQAEQEYLASCFIMLSRGLRDSDAAPTSTNMADGYKYKCTLCDKVFASYQALDGHKTRHRKPPAAAAPSDGASSSGTTHEKLHQSAPVCSRRGRRLAGI
jgi:hypothetical protein